MKYDNVVQFFKKIPNVYNFNEIYLRFYISPSDTEKEFQSNFNKFSDAYTLIFGNI